MQRFHRKLFSLNLLSGICVLPRCSNQHSQMTLQNRSLSGCRLGGRCHQERHYILGKKPHIHYLNRQLLQSSLYFPYSFNRSRWFDLAHEIATRSRCFNRSRWVRKTGEFATRSRWSLKRAKIGQKRLIYGPFVRAPK